MKLFHNIVGGLIMHKSNANTSMALNVNRSNLPSIWYECTENPVANPRGRQGRVPSLSKFFHFFFQFLATILQNNRLAYPLRELAFPPGSSESVTLTFSILSKYPWKCQHSVLKLWLTQLLPRIKKVLVLLEVGHWCLLWINHRNAKF